jgi:hypothetical protein
VEPFRMHAPLEHDAELRKQLTSYLAASEAFSPEGCGRRSVGASDFDFGIAARRHG